MRRLALSTCLALLCAQAGANGTITAHVVGVRVDKDGRGMVIFDQQVGGAPASCRHSAYLNALSFDANTAGGRAIEATALTAKATGAPVNAWGTGDCSIYGGAWVEDWSYGIVQQ
jgi:hypothetical protein